MIKRGVTAYIVAAFKNKKLIIKNLIIFRYKYKDIVVEIAYNSI
jgi:hypothetical protein